MCFFLATVVLSVGNSKEPMTVHLLHLSSTDVDRGVCLFPVEMNFREYLLGCLAHYPSDSL